jgi:hypothetical protein
MYFKLLICLLVAVHAYAGTDRTQSLELEPGWNAIFLEVDPDASAPADLFENTPVDVVASFTAAGKMAQFTDEPTADMLRAYGWHVWYAPSRADHFLTTLYAIKGGSPYLVHATTNATLEVSGSAAPVRPNWVPNAFNFTGFTVQTPGGPTFSEFFAASAAHQSLNVYRMTGGTWRKLQDPGAAAMRSGEAFWIFCEGKSAYAGPVQVTTPSSFGLQFSPAKGDALSFRNLAQHPVTVTLEHIVDADAPVPLLATMLVHDQESGTISDAAVELDGDAWQFVMPALDAGEAVKFPLILDSTRIDFSERQSFIKVTTDMGQLQYIPVIAFGSDN